MRDWFEDLGGADHRKMIVKRELESSVLLNPDLTPRAKPAQAAGPPLRVVDERDGFFIPDGGTFKISPAFADMIHYRPAPLHKPDLPEGGENEGR